MSFLQAVKTCLSKYATFRGRAARPEFWWFMLFWFLAVTLVEALLGEGIGSVAFLALLLPAVAVTARRLHDVGRSGWWQLVMPVPVVGVLLLLYWYVQPSELGINRFD